MSNLRPGAAPDVCECDASERPQIDAYPAHAAQVGQLDIRRALPLRQRRMVGPWCFLDRYGPLTFSSGKPMDVAPHPHIGLQTVSWLLDGEVLHRDSLGFEELIVPGELNLMTSGRGIAHSEETPTGAASGVLNGVQLWVALPDSARNGEADFGHYDQLPVVEQPGGSIRLLIGELSGAASPARAFSPMIGAQLDVHGGHEVGLDLDGTWEHALFVLDGSATIEGQTLEPDILYYLGVNRRALALSSSAGARVLLLGGAPFGERIFMWWNFVARSHEEIARAREEWQAGSSFGEVRGYQGSRLEAPPLRGRVSAPAAS